MRQETVLLSVLFVSGLCHQRAGQPPRLYYVVYDQKNWTEAQSYCREKHIDLATVDNMEDVKKLNGMVDLNTLNNLQDNNGIWIGLHVDLNNWRWSLAGSGVEEEFRKWSRGEPNNKDGREHCGMVYDNGYWNDENCATHLMAICVGARGLTENFFLINKSMTWTEALSYCIGHYTDLASVRNESENQMIQQLVPNGKKVWIGLYRDFWKWSDGSISPFRNWNTAPNDQVLMAECVAIEFNMSGKWVKSNCDQRRAFICYSSSAVTVKRVRVKLTKGVSSLDLNNPAVMEEILKQLKQRLKDNGVTEDIKLKWKEQSDGKVFHREEEKKEKKREEL